MATGSMMTDGDDANTNRPIDVRVLNPEAMALAGGGGGGSGIDSHRLRRRHSMALTI